jgi:hypothetical protein
MYEIRNTATVADGSRIWTCRIDNLQAELALVQRQADRCVHIPLRNEPKRPHLDTADLFDCVGECSLFPCAASRRIVVRIVHRATHGHTTTGTAPGDVSAAPRYVAGTSSTGHHAYATPFTHSDSCPRPPGHSFPRCTNPAPAKISFMRVESVVAHSGPSWDERSDATIR